MVHYIWATIISVFIIVWRWLSPISWNNPEYFWGGLPVSLFLLWCWLHPYRYSALRFSSIQHLKEVKPTWRVRIRRLLPLVRFVAVLLLVLALSRPQLGDERNKVTTRGIAIIMAIDISNSMGQFLSPGEEGKGKTRLDVVKEVFHSFVAGDGEMAGRKNDLIGLVAFGGYAESRCPLTLDHGVLLEILEQVEIPSREELVDKEELKTAVGDAILAGGKRLADYRWNEGEEDKDEKKSKVLILLTDGESNTGEDPVWAAGVVRDWGVKIYTIGIGGPVYRKKTNLFGEVVWRKYESSSFDKGLLEKIAEIGKGQNFNARDRQTLRSIYRQIDSMEKSEVETTYLEYKELYLWFLLPACSLLVLEKLLAVTVLRKIP